MKKLLIASLTLIFCLSSIFNIPLSFSLVNNLALAETISACETPEITADFPYESQFIPVFGSNIHYIDEGEGEPILFIHGNASRFYSRLNKYLYMQ